jgi:hypothetical protein
MLKFFNIWQPEDNTMVSKHVIHFVNLVRMHVVWRRIDTVSLVWAHHCETGIRFKFLYCIRLLLSRVSSIIRFIFPTIPYLSNRKVLTAVTMKSAIFWLVTPFSSDRASHFGVTYLLHLQGKLSLLGVSNLLLGLLSALKMEAMRSSETSGSVQTTRPYPEGWALRHFSYTNVPYFSFTHYK